MALLFFFLVKSVECSKLKNLFRWSFVSSKLCECVVRTHVVERFHQCRRTPAVRAPDGCAGINPKGPASALA
jgi:hypothetical protein